MTTYTVIARDATILLLLLLLVVVVVVVVIFICLNAGGARRGTVDGPGQRKLLLQQDE